MADWDRSGHRNDRNRARDQGYYGQDRDDRYRDASRRDGLGGTDQYGFQGFAQDTGLGFDQSLGQWGTAEHYLAVRNRYQQQLDRDYDEFRRARQERFNTDFDRWRQECRQKLQEIRNGMDVVDSDDTRIGTVDKVEGGHVKLTLQGENGRHRYLTPGWISSVDDKVRLNKTIDEAQRLWRTIVRPDRRGR